MSRYGEGTTHGLAIDRHDRVQITSSTGHGARLLTPDGTPLAFVGAGELSAYAAASR